MCVCVCVKLAINGMCRFQCKISSQTRRTPQSLYCDPFKYRSSFAQPSSGRSIRDSFKVSMMKRLGIKAMRSSLSIAKSILVEL